MKYQKINLTCAHTKAYTGKPEGWSERPSRIKFITSVNMGKPVKVCGGVHSFSSWLLVWMVILWAGLDLLDFHVKGKENKITGFPTKLTCLSVYFTSRCSVFIQWGKRFKYIKVIQYGRVIRMQIWRTFKITFCARECSGSAADWQKLCKLVLLAQRAAWGRKIC